MIEPFEFDRSFAFDVPRAALWAALTNTDRFPELWPWLKEFDTGGRGLEPGVEAACVVRGPLPYALRFTVAVVDVVPEHLVETVVSGDISGRARLDLDATDTTTAARLSWTVQVVDPALRATARVARPLMEWGHDWVVRRGVRTFRARGLDGAG